MIIHQNNVIHQRSRQYAKQVINKSIYSMRLSKKKVEVERCLKTYKSLYIKLYLNYIMQHWTCFAYGTKDVSYTAFKRVSYTAMEKHEFASAVRGLALSGTGIWFDWLMLTSHSTRTKQTGCVLPCWLQEVLANDEKSSCDSMQKQCSYQLARWAVTVASRARLVSGSPNKVVTWEEPVIVSDPFLITGEHDSQVSKAASWHLSSMGCQKFL